MGASFEIGGLSRRGSGSSKMSSAQGVQSSTLKARRFGPYVAGAAVAADLAYLVAIVPLDSPASSNSPKVVAKKGEAKGGAPQPGSGSKQ